MPPELDNAMLRNNTQNIFTQSEAFILFEILADEQNNQECKIDYLLEHLPYNLDIKNEESIRMYKNIDFETLSYEDQETFLNKYPNHEPFTEKTMKEYIKSLIERGYVFENVEK
jgi:calcineurin-like phosphoesterase family protein